MSRIILMFKKLISGITLSFEIRITDEVMRSTMLLGVVALVVTAFFYSKQDKHVETKISSHGIEVTQRPYLSEERARFIPAPIRPEEPEASADDRGPPREPRPPRRKIAEGQEFYYERIRIQGDSDDVADGEYTLVKRPCVREVDMPEVCNMPRRDRVNHPVVRE